MGMGHINVLLLISLNLLCTNASNSVVITVANPLATDSWAQAISDRGVRYADWGGGKELYTVVAHDVTATDPTSMTLRVYNMAGAKVGQTTQSPTSPLIRRTQCLIPIQSWPMTYILVSVSTAAEDPWVVRYTLAESSGTYSWAPSGVALQLIPLYGARTAEYIPNTDYLLWGYNGILSRYDVSLNTRTSLVDRSNSPKHLPDTNEIFVTFIILYQGSAVFDVMRNRFVIADLTTPFNHYFLDGPLEYEDLVTSKLANPNPTTDAIVDNLRSNIIFVVTYKQSETKRRYIYDTDLIATQVGQRVAYISTPFVPATGAPYALTNLANVGTLPLILAMDNGAIYLI